MARPSAALAILFLLSGTLALAHHSIAGAYDESRHVSIDGIVKPGDRVLVTGSPARTESRALYTRRLERPADGFLYEQIGSSPRVRGLPR